MWSGLSLGVTPALTALLAPLWGRLADRFGRKIMVERSLVSFVIVMAAMAFVTPAVARLRAARGPGALRRLRRADADDGGRFGAAGQDGAGDRHRPDGAAARPGARARSFGGIVAAIVGLRRAFLVDGRLLPRRARARVRASTTNARARARCGRRTGAPRVTFRNVLAFENFLLMMAVIFGLQFVDRSFGPVLPLYVGELGTPADARAARLGRAVLDCRRRRRARPSLLRARSCSAARAAAAHRGGRRGGRGRRCAATSSRTTSAGCSWRRRSSASRSASATTAAYTAAAARDSGERARRRLRPADDRVARRPRRQPDRLRPARATSIRAVFALDVVSLVALAVVGAPVRRRRRAGAQRWPTRGTGAESCDGCADCETGHGDARSHATRARITSGIRGFVTFVDFVRTPTTPYSSAC